MNLPDGITVKKSINDDKVTYLVVKNQHQEIGGVIVSETMAGDTRLDPYVNDPQTQENIQSVGAVAQQMSDALIEQQAAKPAHLRYDATPPTEVPEGTQVYETKAFSCSKCNKIIAKLIFSWESTTQQEMESVSKHFELESTLVDHSMWILGAPNCDNDDTAKHLTLQISPRRGDVYWEHPDDMNQRLIELDNRHC